MLGNFQDKLPLGHAQIADAVKVDGQVGDHVAQKFLFADAVDLPVEPDIALQQLVGFAGLIIILLNGDILMQPVDIVRAQAVAGHPGQIPLHHGPEIQELGHDIHIDKGYKSAASGTDHHQLFLRQVQQGFADGRAGDSQQFADLGLVQFLTGLQVEAHDVLGQGGEHILLQGLVILAGSDL